MKAGADLVLSVNASNRDHAPDWGVEVVAIPDVPGTLDGLDATVEFLESRGVRYRLDPILEPIGFGFADSLGRYIETRRRWPETPILMGIGNLTELTDVDSAGVNTLLVGFCQELGVRSVLTTAVINWARSSVVEVDLARRLALSCGDPEDAAEAGRAPPGDAPRRPAPSLRPRGPRATWPRGSRTPTGGSSPRTAGSTHSTTPITWSAPTRSSSSSRWALTTPRTPSTWVMS